MKKKRILVIGMTGILGGVETFIRNIYSEFDYEQYEVDFLHHSPEGILFEDEFRRNGSHIYYCEKFMKNPVKSYRQLKVIYDEGQYDVVHCNACSTNMMVYFLPAILMKRKPMIVMHSHSGMSEKKDRIFRHLLLRPVLNHFVDQRLACSDKAGEWMYGKKRFQVILNGVKTKDFIYNEGIRRNIRKKYGYSDDDIVIGSIGRIVEVKNHKFLIDIMKHLDKKYKCVIIGDGELKKELLRQIEIDGMTNRIKILPSTPKINEFYQMFDIYAMTSIFEGLPMTCVEAQISGLPVLLSDGISHNAKFSDRVQFISVQDVDGWIHAITAIQLNRGRKQPESIKQLDCKNSVRQLSEIFSL